MNTYPEAWRTGEIQRAIYDRAEWRCEHCGAQFTPGDTRHPTITNANGRPLILTVHHLNENKSDCRYENLVSVCQRCHLHIQGTWHPGAMLPWDAPPARGAQGLWDWDMPVKPDENAVSGNGHQIDSRPNFGQPAQARRVLYTDEENRTFIRQRLEAKAGIA